MKMLLLSDLHIHLSNCNIDASNADYVLLLGDITPNTNALLSFLDAKFSNYEGKVIFVPGNHEYEGHNIYKYDDILRKELSQFHNVVFLQNDEFIDKSQSVRFLGTTLWSDFSLLEPLLSKESVMKEAKNKIEDYNTIIGEKGLLSPYETVKLHEKATRFLHRKLRKESFDGDTIVLTHFLPHKNSINKKFKDSALNPYFCSDLSNLLGFSKFWFHGHTHDSCDYTFEGTRVMCNPRGYSKLFDVSGNPNFSPTLSVPLNDGEKKPSMKY